MGAKDETVTDIKSLPAKKQVEDFRQKVEKLKETAKKK